MNPPRNVIDRAYLMHECLGQGGMGSVFRATHLLDGRSVAVKLIAPPEVLGDSSPATSDPMFRLALAREFQTLASLHHPNVVQVYSYGFDEHLGPYVAMEHLANSKHLLAAADQLEPTKKVLLIVQLLRALVYVHQRGVIHRDIKAAKVTTERNRTSNDPQRFEVLAN